LSIVAHDKFQEIVDAANQPHSPIQMKSIVLDPADLARPTRTVVSSPIVETRLGIKPDHLSATTEIATDGATSPFTTAEAQQAAAITYKVIKNLERNPKLVASTAQIAKPDVRARI